MSPPNIPDSNRAPKSVSRFESSLLKLLRYCLHRLPYDQIETLIAAKPNQPKCLSDNCLELIRDSLRKGVVLHLVHRGAWRDERYLRNGQPRGGRLWERNELNELTLKFSRNVVDFLIWLTAYRPMERQNPLTIDLNTVTPADWYFFFMAFDVLRLDLESLPALRDLPIFNQNPYCRLVMAEEFSNVENPADLPSFDLLFTGLGGLIFEAMQHDFADRAYLLEQRKGQTGDWSIMGNRGREELRVYQQFCATAQRYQRLDLARFLLQALARVFRNEMDSAFWIGGLQGNGPPRLADRISTQRAALALLRVGRDMQNWERQARSSGYLDEDYAAAKFWLAEWERFGGSTIVHRCERILNSIEPLRSDPESTTSTE